MTNQVAEAIAWLEKDIKRCDNWLAECDEQWVSQEEMAFANRHKCALEVHLAEFREHEGAHSDLGYLCQKCTKSLSQNGMTIRQYPCDFVTIKAQRLLGKASND